MEKKNTILLITATTLTLFGIIRGQGKVENRSCDESSTKNYTELHERLRNYRVWGNPIDPYFIHPSLAPDMTPPTKLSVSFSAFLYGHRRCHRKMKFKDSSDLMLSSSCPWYIIFTYDAERYPEYMATARCTCKNCYGMNGERTRPKDQTEAKCKPVYTNVKVLRQQYVNKTKVCDSQTKIFSYEETYEKVALGCVCKFQSTKNGTTTLSGQ